MGKYLVSSLLFFSYLMNTSAFINSLFKINKEPIIKINEGIVNNNKIFNPFENSNQLSLTQDIMNSCESPNEKITSSDMNFLKINLLINNHNNDLPYCESKPLYLKTVPELTNEIKMNVINELNNHNIIEKINHLIDFDHKTKISKPLIKYSSSLLPAMDGIAHHVLTLNQNFINFVLDNDIISLELKKKLVLFSIQAAQNGDNTGSLILQFYYDMVNHLL